MHLPKIRRFINSGLVGILLACSSESTAPAKKSSGTPNAPQNKAPVITSSPLTNCNEGTFYQYAIEANDPDGDPINYSKTEGPDWLSVSHNTLFGNCPEISQDLTVPVKIRVADSKGASVEQSYNLLLKNSTNTYLLSGSQLDNMQISDSTFVFAEATNFLPNDLIASGINAKTPQGLLKKITSVSADKRTIQTSQASLEDFVAKANLSFQKSLNPSEIQSLSFQSGALPSTANLDGFNFSVSLKNVVLYDRDGNQNTTNDQFIANGSLSFNIDYSFDMRIDSHSMRYLKFRQKLKQSSDIVIGSNISWLASIADVKIAEYSFNPVVLGFLPTIVPIPIVVTPKIGVYASINPTKINPLSVNIKQNSELSVGIEFDNGSWKNLSDYSTAFDFSFLAPVQGDWDLNFSAGPRLSLPLYGIAGPTASLNGKLRLTSQNNDWKLYGGLLSVIGVDAKIFGKNISAHAGKVIDFEKLLAQKDPVPTPPPAADSTFTDSRDGKTYKMIKIGNQTWMAQNLDFNAANSEYYNGNSAHASAYGKLYDWNSSKTVCPSNWHLPADSEWNTLYAFLGGKNASGTGGKMKAPGTLEASTGRWRQPNTGATNESKFSAQPGGMKENSVYSKEGFSSFMWVDTTPFALAYELAYDSDRAGSSLAASNPAGFKFSIRCVKN